MSKKYIQLANNSIRKFGQNELMNGNWSRIYIFVYNDNNGLFFYRKTCISIVTYTNFVFKRAHLAEINDEMLMKAIPNVRHSPSLQRGLLDRKIHPIPAKPPYISLQIYIYVRINIYCSAYLCCRCRFCILFLPLLAN